MKTVRATQSGARKPRVTVPAAVLLSLLGAVGSAWAEQGRISLQDPQFGTASGSLEWNGAGLTATGSLSAGERGASLWLSWSAGEVDYNELVQTVRAGQSADFKQRFASDGSPSKITLSLCDDNPGEGCGPQQRF